MFHYLTLSIIHSIIYSSADLWVAITGIITYYYYVFKLQLFIFSFIRITAEITASKIWVNGNLECGSPSSLFNGSLTFTLTGCPPLVPQTDMEGGDKSIAVFNGGRISLHGKKQVSWDRLDATAQVGATQIQLINPVDWQVGDQIVIAKTGRYHFELIF